MKVLNPGAKSLMSALNALSPSLSCRSRGGFGFKDNPAIFSLEEESGTEVKKRLMAGEVARAIREGFLEGEPGLVKQVTLKDEKGRVVLGAKVGIGR